MLTPGFTCTNGVLLILTDNTTAGGAKQTASTTTTGTFSATANDSVNYLASCRMSAKDVTRTYSREGANSMFAAK